MSQATYSDYQEILRNLAWACKQARLTFDEHRTCQAGLELLNQVLELPPVAEPKKRGRKPKPRVPEPETANETAPPEVTEFDVPPVREPPPADL